jgi:methylmalonyl-CoA mutase, C-terminal domain
MSSSGRSTPPRVLLAKPGLDGHDRGIKVIAMALRDAGVEVIYLGLRQGSEAIIRAAEAEAVDVIGLSILSGAHLSLCSELLAVRDARGMHDVPVVVGGTIPSDDIAALRALGVSVVFPVGSDLPALVQTILTLANVA